MIANLILSLTLGGAIASGSVSESTTTFNTRPPKNSSSVYTYTENYTQMLSYQQTYNTTGNMLCVKYECKSTQYTSYAYIESYSYSFTVMNPYSTQVGSVLTDFRNITFYKINFYAQTSKAEIDLTYTLQTNLVSGSATITADSILYQYNNQQDINQYLDLSNFSTLKDYTPSNVTELLERNNQTLLDHENTNQITIDLGDFINNTNNTQSYVMITDKNTITLNNNAVGVYTENLITPTSNNVTLTTFSYDYEVIDLPTLMLTILTLPFSFISLAFNPITLFPNTPYQLNLGNMIMVLFTVLLLLWIVQKILKKG